MRRNRQAPSWKRFERTGARRQARSATPPTIIASSRICAHARPGRSPACSADIYRCRMFYGNGTARLVRDSAWRDQGAGVLPDLGSHLLDTARVLVRRHRRRFSAGFRVEPVREPRAAIMSSSARAGAGRSLRFEMTLLSWRNHFTCDVLAEKRHRAHRVAVQMGTDAPSRMRRRVLPSGRPPKTGGHAGAGAIRPGQLEYGALQAARCRKRRKQPRQ